MAASTFFRSPRSATGSDSRRTPHWPLPENQTTESVSAFLSIFGSLRLICSRSLGRSYDMLPEQSMTRRWSVGVSTGFADAWAPLPMGWRTRYMEVETLKLLAVVMGVPLVVGFTGRGYLHR